MTHSKSEIAVAVSMFAVLIGVWLFFGYAMWRSRKLRGWRVVTMLALVIGTLILVGSWIVSRLIK
jgi:ABC-type spermidine/putrescine transport system permease subunit II